MAATTTAHLKRALNMVTEFTIGLMAQDTKVTGLRTRWLGLACLSGPMVVTTKASLKTE